MQILVIESNLCTFSCCMLSEEIRHALTRVRCSRISRFLCCRLHVSMLLLLFLCRWEVFSRKRKKCVTKSWCRLQWTVHSQLELLGQLSHLSLHSQWVPASTSKYCNQVAKENVSNFNSYRKLPTYSALKPSPRTSYSTWPGNSEFLKWPKWRYHIITSSTDGEGKCISQLRMSRYKCENIMSDGADSGVARRIKQTNFPLSSLRSRAP